MVAPVPEDVAQGAALRAGRVAALGGLVQLLWVAEQHDRAGRWRGGQHVREAHLARLVNEQDVHDRAVTRHLARGPRPGRRPHDVELVPFEHASNLRVVADPRGDAAGGLASLLGLLPDPDRERDLALRAQIGRDLVHRVEEVADHLVAVGHDAHLQAGVHEPHDHVRAGERLARSRAVPGSGGRRPRSSGRGAPRRPASTPREGAGHPPRRCRWDGPAAGGSGQPRGPARPGPRGPAVSGRGRRRPSRS